MALRTVELGRAVISSMQAQAQLWLKTLITVSPQHNSLTVEQLNQQNFLELLSSGKAWVCRGNGLHLVLELCVAGQPLGHIEKEQLALSIVKAPVRLLPGVYLPC
jgi:hypothetical protein